MSPAATLARASASGSDRPRSRKAASAPAQRRNAPRALGADGQGPRTAEGEHAGPPRSGECRRGRLGLAFPTEQGRRLVLVDEQKIDRLEGPGRHRRRRRQIEDRARPGRARPLERGERDGEWDLVLAEERGARAEHGVVELVERDVEIGAARHQDLVLARPVDGDHRRAGGPGRARKATDLDPGLFEPPAEHRAPRIEADPAEETDPRTELGRRRGLVGALAAVGQPPARAEHGLARFRQRLDLEDEVGVDRAQHQEHAAPPRATTTRSVRCGLPPISAAPTGRGRPVSAWRTGSSAGPCACRTSCARRRGRRGSGNRST